MACIIGRRAAYGRLDYPHAYAHFERVSENITLSLDGRAPVKGWGHQSVLKSLLEAKEPVTYGCASGNCGACRYVLVSGEVDEKDTGLLSDEQRARGEFLTCQAKPKTALVLEKPKALSSDPIDIEGVVTRVERPTSDLVKLRIKLDSPLDYEPGQYALLQTPHGPGRAYSFASLGGMPVVEFHIRAVPGGKTGMAIYEKASRGDRVRLTAPMGEAYAENLNRPILLVATGTGLAPMKAVLAKLKQINHQAPLRLLWGNRSPDDLYEEAAIEALMADHPDAEFVKVFSRAGEQPARVTSRLHSMAPSLMGWVVFCAGNPAMVDDVEAQMPLMGLAPQDFHADRFTSSEPD